MILFSSFQRGGEERIEYTREHQMCSSSLQLHPPTSSCPGKIRCIIELSLSSLESRPTIQDVRLDVCPSLEGCFTFSPPRAKDLKYITCGMLQSAARLVYAAPVSVF